MAKFFRPDLHKSPATRRSRLLIGGAIAAAMLLGYYLVFLRDDAASGLEGRVGADTAQAGKVAAKLYYASLEANIRDRASTQQSTILGKLARGESLSGTVVTGEDGSSSWLKLADGKGFIALMNLSETQPPELIQPLGDKKWTANAAVEIWAQPDAASTLIDRVAAGSELTLTGLTANDYAEVKLAPGGVGYIADGARIAALAALKPVALAFDANSCSFGRELDARFTAMGERLRASYKALENREYESEEARAKALTAVEGKSSFQRMERSFEGLTITGIAQHYESQSVYFAEPVARVIAVFRSKGYRVGRDGSIPSADLYAGIGTSSGEGGRYGKSDLSCGV